MSQKKSEIKIESQTSKGLDEKRKTNPLDYVSVDDPKSGITPNKLQDTPVKNDVANTSHYEKILKNELNSASSKDLISVTKLNMRSG